MDFALFIESFQKKYLKCPEKYEYNDSESNKIKPDIEFQRYFSEKVPYFFIKLQTYIPFLSE